MRFSLAFEFGSLSHATHFMRVSLTIRIQVSISYYASVLVFCMMDIWMFSLAKICRHARVYTVNTDSKSIFQLSIVRPSTQNPPYLMDFLDLKS